MTLEEWKKLVGIVTDEMKVYTRPYVTPLRTSDEEKVRLLGTGSYIAVKDRRVVLSCEHVTRNKTVEYQFWGSDRIFRVTAPFTYDKTLDIAFAPVPESDWTAENHGAKTIPFDRFAATHQPAEHEILFFRGFAGENAHYGFGVHEANATAYGSQQSLEKPIQSDKFEILWEPDKIEFSQNTPSEIRSGFRHEDPHGFSGSLVWNTQYVEKSATGAEWSPDDAVITGLLQWSTSDRQHRRCYQGNIHR
jgi:hypothetical protein